MKNSLRIHKWTHNEFNIFILGVLTRPQQCSIAILTPFAPHIIFFLLPRRRKTGSSDIAELPAPVLNYTIAIGTLSVKTFLSLSHSSFYLYFHSMVSYSFHLPCFILLSFALHFHCLAQRLPPKWPPPPERPPPLKPPLLLLEEPLLKLLLL